MASSSRPYASQHGRPDATSTEQVGRASPSHPTLLSVGGRKKGFDSPEQLHNSREIHFFPTRTIFFQARPLFSKRSVRADPTLSASCLLLLLDVSGTAEHGAVSAQCGAVTRRHGIRRSHHFSSCTAPQGGPAQALKSLKIRDDDIKNICV